MNSQNKQLTWWEPMFGPEEVDAVAEIVRSGYVNEGRKTAEFADAIRSYAGVELVEATSSGTIALFLALKAVGVGPGDEVIVPDLTFIATASAVALAGANVRLVDIRSEDLNIDPDGVEAAISPASKAILPVHVNGRCANMARLDEIAARHGLAIIEDAAEALGSKSGGRALGSMSDAGCISLAPTKIITSAQGGLVLTDRSDIKDSIIRLKDHGRLSRSWNYHPEVGFNFKYNDILAALALAQFQRLPARLDLARRQFKQYQEGMEGIERIVFIKTDFSDGAVPLWVDAWLDETVDAGEFIAALKAQNVVCRPFWPALHEQAPYADSRKFPNATRAAAQGVWFPSGQGKTEDDIARVIEAVKSILQKG